MNIKKLKEKLLETAQTRKMLVHRQDDLSAKIKNCSTELENIKKASAIISLVAKETQALAEYHISELVTLSLTSVFDDPYKFSLEFVQRRHKTEADLFFVRGKNKLKPIDSSGGGPLDISAFALRLACWKINKPGTRPLLILDEPFKFLSKDKHHSASKMVSELADKMGIQIILNSHSTTIGESAKSSTRIGICNRVSHANGEIVYIK